MAGFAAVLAAQPVAARVTRIAIDRTQAEAGGAGPTEIITGRAFGELDPRAPGNAIITDIDRAPLNSHGMVEYVAKFTLTKPADMARASGVLWYDLVNRGAPVTANRGAASPTDDGHVRLISGWQGDLVQTEANWDVQVPVARNPDGSAITGPVLSRTADAAPGSAVGRLGVRRLHDHPVPGRAEPAHALHQGRLRPGEALSAHL